MERWMAGAFAVGVCASQALAGPGARGDQQPVETVFGVRTLYAPAHFGNSYEVMGEHEMRQMIAEAAHWGFDRYADWFDVVDCSDPFAPRQELQLGAELWARKKANFRSAQQLGLPCDLIVTPNHVYVDKCKPELLATRTDRIFGQLICPSKPEAREIIHRMYEALFADLAKSGVRLSSLSFGPYDYGGCACDACAPWILTFAELSKEIHDTAARYHPGIEATFIGWWWSAEEHRLFAEWADANAPGWAKRLFLHIPYGQTTVGDVPLPEGCEKGAFVHIGYAEKAQPRDNYGHMGPAMAAHRIEKTLADLEQQGCKSFMAYSEGLADDVNKALLAGIGSGQCADADEVLTAYAQRYFQADTPEQAQAWAEWLEGWGEPFGRDAAAAKQALAGLSSARGGQEWRRDQWEMKAELFRLNAAIGTGNDWSAERLALVDEFWRAHERLQRGVWGLGPQRHIFRRQYTPVPWYRSWAVYVSEHVGVADDEA